MMKFKALIPVLILSVTSFGFKSGDSVVFDQSLNGRADSDVRKQTQNIRFTVAKGTQARIQGMKELRAGNYSLEVLLTSGPRKGEKVWVYYNRLNPGLKLFKDMGQQQTGSRGDQRVVVRDVRQATSAETTRAHTVIPVETAAEAEKASLVQAARSLDSLAQSLSRQTEIPCDAESFKPGPYPESTSRAITVDAYNEPFPYPQCSTRAEGYDACLENGAVTSFSFKNGGPNSVNDHTGVYEPDFRYREFRFEMAGGARQELEFHVSDSMSSTLSEIQESYFKIFPRRVTPSIRVENGIYHVTLNTGEVVRYKADTREIVGGVLQESKIVYGRPAGVSYTGAGVIVRADKRGDDPRTQNNFATISKPQCGPTEKCKPCRVPVGKLWTTNADDPRFRFPTDEGFDQFLRKTCGFGL